jgi:O-antigen/teichoic acid export membrane protein
VIDKIRQLVRSSIIYGAGNYGVKLVGFFLIPVYTRYLTPTDYGVLAMVSSFNRVLFILLNLGQSTALFRFYYDPDTPEGRDRVIAGSLWIILLFSLPLALVALALSFPTAIILLGNGALYPLVAIGVLTMACQALQRLPFSVLRANARDTQYALWSIARTALSAGIAVALVVGARWGVRGVLLGALAAEAIVLTFLLPMVLRALRAGWAGPEMRAQLYFGLALVPAGFASFVLDLSDRFFLKHYASLGDVGIYSIGYRFGEIIFFVVTAVQLAWPQFVFSNHRSERAPELYAYASTYYMAGLLSLVLGLSVLAPEVIKLMATPAFHGATVVVPVIALSGLCQGLNSIGTIGLLVRRRPIIRSLALIVAATLNIVLNYLFIPKYGMLGAAWATLIAFLVEMILLVSVALRYYPIPYQWSRMARLLLAAGGVYAASSFLPPASPVLTVAIKACLLATFPVLLWLLRFFESTELRYAQQLATGVLRRMAPSRSV